MYAPIKRRRIADAFCFFLQPAISSVFFIIFFLLTPALLPIKIWAQNVGIGTNSPIVRLHVASSASSPARFDGAAGMYIGLFEAGTYRGYFGSYSGAAVDVDFGTGLGNSAGDVHLTIEGNPGFTLNNSKNVGIGTTNPGERLVIANGNLQLQSSLLGVMLNGADQPLITRGWDGFTSGIYYGIGRWGLFMEPSRLTLGIPNIAGKAIEFARYNTNSSRTTLMTVGVDGELNRPATGGADLVPVCMGAVRWNNGSLTNTPIISSSGNFTLTPYADAGMVEITIAGHYYTTAGYITQVTCIRDTNYGSTTGFAVTEDSGNGKLRVYTYINGNTQYSRSFQFVVYKM